MAWLRLIRFPNLVIVALTQYLIYYTVFFSFYELVDNNPNLSLSPLLFFLLVFTTMLIAAGGYVINDIVDYKIDLINKPDKVFIGQSISIQNAWNVYFSCIGLGFGLSAYIALKTNNLPLLIIYPIAVLLLYFYSTFFKKKYFFGNLIVALFCAFVPGIVWVAEWDSGNYWINNDEAGMLHGYFNFTVIWAYICFAFLSTLLREVVKDIEDIEGDKKECCRTIPIVSGILVAKIWAVFLTFSLLLGFYFFQIEITDNRVDLIDYYNGFFLVLPTIYILIRLFFAKEKKDFSHLSFVIKIVMLFGLLYLLIV